MELRARRPTFSLWFIHSFITNLQRVHQTVSPVLSSGKLEITIEKIKKDLTIIIVIIIAFK